VNGILFMQLFILGILELKEHQPQHFLVTLSFRKVACPFEFAEPRNHYFFVEGLDDRFFLDVECFFYIMGH